MAIPTRSDPSPQRRGEEDSGAKMSFLEHLGELRKRILYSLAAIGIGLCVGLYYSSEFYDFLARPMFTALRDSHLPAQLIYTSPAGRINVLIEVGLYLGIVIASPFVFHQIWLFVAPGLYRHERRAAVIFLCSSVMLFLAGTAFAYYVLLPFTLKFLISFPGPYTPLISINEYLDLILVVLLGLGIIFELPVLIFFLALFGIVTPRFLWNNFRYAILIIAIVAAVVTPTTDALTMTIFMAPLIGLYFLGIGVAYLVVRWKKQAPVARAEVR